mgnify:CR=1 FL=1
MFDTNALAVHGSIQHYLPTNRPDCQWRAP